VSELPPPAGAPDAADAADATGAANVAGVTPPARRSTGAQWTREWLILIVLTVAGTFLIRTFVVQTYRIPSGSMEKTLHGCTPHCNNDRVLVDKVSYKLHSIHRRDIVVFQATGDWIQVVGGKSDVIKRVIGLPGDTVSCCDAQGHVVVDGVSQNEPYVYDDNRYPFGPITVGKGQLFVMGDHRGDSSDSRYNGTIPESSVVGHAFLRVWPIPRIHTLH
jgi:signal peptidase I